MQRHTKTLLWILPTAGILLGLAGAYISIYGLYHTWHFIGNPSEKISRIIGTGSNGKLMVETESGNIYSLLFYNNARIWNKEENLEMEFDPDLGSSGEYISLPLLRKIDQLYVQEIIYSTENRGFVKFALVDGNLWMYEHIFATYGGVFLILFPFFGLIMGSIIDLIIYGIYLHQKHKKRNLEKNI
jgi:hypothetical protein